MIENQVTALPLECLYFYDTPYEMSLRNCTSSWASSSASSSPAVRDDERGGGGGGEGEGEKIYDDDGVPFVSREIAIYFEVTFWVVSYFLVSTFGSVANIINVIVYAKMGMGDVVNISLLGLAVSDFISVFTVMWLSVCYALLLLDPPGLVFDPLVFLYVTAGWPHFVFSRVSCYITAMISVERCLCVVKPFKVKQIVTPTRIKAIITFIFISVPASYVPALIQHKMAWQWDPERNQTRIMAAFTDKAKDYQQKSYYSNVLILPTLSFIAITACVVITTISLRRKIEWKKEQEIAVISTKSSSKAEVKPGDDKNKQDGDQSTSKELRVVRMLTLVCVLFLVCYSPSVLMIYVRMFIKGLDMFQKHHNLHLLIYSFIFLSEISNSSVNIFIYYNMSTKYRETFNALFRRSK